MLSNSSQRHIIKISLSIVFACLFHQIAILLWINLLLLFLRLRMRKEALIFLGISMLIPLTYFLIYGMTSHEWTLFGTIRFALRDYLSGTAQMPEIQQVTLLTAVSIMRIFMQVHGYMYAMFLAAPIFTIAIGIVSIGLIGFGIVSLFLKNRVKEPINRNKAFITFLWFQVALTLLFSAFSNGNAEFMTMLPFLLIILYTHYFSKNSPILTFATALFVWNFYFAVYPYHCKSLSANSEIADLVAEFPEAIFVVSDKPTVENIYLYRNVGGKLPEIISSHCYTKDDFTENKLEGKMVITDVADSERAMSRARVTQIGGFDFSELKRVRVLGEYEGLGDNLMGW